MTTTTTLVLLPVPPPLALQLPHWLMRHGRPCGGRGWWTALCSGVGQGECVDECGGGDGGLVAWRAPAEATGSASAAEATADGVGSGGDQNGGEELQSVEGLRRSLDLSGESMVSANGLEPKNGNGLPSKPFHFNQQPNPNQSIK